MKLPTLSLFFLALFGFSNCDVADHGDFLEELMPAIKKLIEIVEENKMNVTVITSDIHRWAGDQIKEVKEYALRLPSYNVQPTESQITDEKIQEWMKVVQEIPGDNTVVGRARTAHIRDGNTEKIEKTSSIDDKDFVETKLYKTVTSVKDGERGYTVDNPSYENYYNIYVAGEGGKEERIEVIASHVETEVMKKSDTITQDEVDTIVEKMRDGFFKYACRKVMGRVLKDHMDQKFENNDWQVIMDPGEEFYVPAKKYAFVRAVNSTALVYSM